MSNVQQWTCVRCGEQIEGRLAVCWNCGSARDGSPPQDRQEFNFMKKTLAVPPASSFEAAPAPPAAGHKHAFDLLYESDELEGLLRYSPAGTRPIAWSTFWMSLGLVLITLGVVGRSDTEAAAALIIFGTYPLIIGAYDLLKYRSRPLQRLPAIVVNKQDELAEERSEDAVLLVCIETRDGHRRDYNISLELSEKIENGDIGVAYIRGENILDFRKIQT